MVVQTQGSVLSSKWTVVWNLAYRLLPCLLLIGTLPAGSPFPGTYKQCASKSRLRYRVEYYFIYFPVVVQTQGSVLSSKWTVVWKSPGSPFPGTYKQCASKRSALAYRVEYYFIYFPVVVQTQGSVLSSKWTVLWKSAGSPFPGTSMRQ